MRSSGAIIVDEPGQRPPDRIFVIGVWEDTTGGVVLARERERELMVVNGRSWPHTERLSYSVGDTVRWRVLNVSADVHPMHLHGFYFQVVARGDGTGDTSYSEARRDLVVTQRMTPGQTMRMTWIPERAGNWLFHCHIPRHFAPRGPLGLRRPGRTRRVPGGHATANHALDEMNGLVVGVTVGSATSLGPRPMRPDATCVSSYARMPVGQGRSRTSGSPCTKADRSRRLTRAITLVRRSCSRAGSR